MRKISELQIILVFWQMLNYPAFRIKNCLMHDILWNYAFNYWTWTSQTTIGQNNFSTGPNKCHMWWTFELSLPIPMNRVTQNHWHLILIYFYRLIECDGFCTWITQNNVSSLFHSDFILIEFLLILMSISVFILAPA